MIESLFDAAATDGVDVSQFENMSRHDTLRILAATLVPKAPRPLGLIELFDLLDFFGGVVLLDCEREACGTCRGFGVCGESVSFVRSSRNRHCISADSEAVARLTPRPSDEPFGTVSRSGPVGSVRRIGEGRIRFRRLF